MVKRLTAIEKSQSHRGPDDSGQIVGRTPAGLFGLAQQRLSIIDLSSAGHQPMVTPCGRYTLVYNGEVYNYRELRAELAPDPILDISSSDSAVVLAALLRWGPKALSRFNGMWALVFVDNAMGQAIVSRDRMGVKPLFYAIIGDTMVFASEVKGILAGHLDHTFNVNRNAVGRFLLQSLTSPGNETFFEGISAFPPSSFAVLDSASGLPRISRERFWYHPFEQPRTSHLVSPETVKELLFDSVRLRLRSDVPVGIMLSGGLDSSCILAAARGVASDAQIKALSVISRDKETNEEPFIDLMAKHAKRYIPFLREGSGKSWVGPQALSAQLVQTSLGGSYQEREFRHMTLLSLPDLLTSEDRASMSYSREMRTPFLDVRLIEALAEVRPDQKLSKGWTKHILRQAMAPYLPQEICWRKDKKGYTVPGKAWLVGPLREQVEAVLNDTMLAAQAGYIDQSGAKTMYHDLIEGRVGSRYEDILGVVSLEYWLRSFKNNINFV